MNNYMERYEDEFARFLSQNPSRPAVEAFVKSWQTQDEEANRELVARGRLLILVHGVLTEKPHADNDAGNKTHPVSGRGDAWKRAGGCGHNRRVEAGN